MNQIYGFVFGKSSYAPTNLTTFQANLIFLYAKPAQITQPYEILS